MAYQQAETDAFKCGKCGQRRTTYYQMQYVFSLRELSLSLDSDLGNGFKLINRTRYALYA
jgi:hypothetical protein